MEGVMFNAGKEKPGPEFSSRFYFTPSGIAIAFDVVVVNTN